ncbi:MAG: hypothetical protein ABIJ19_02060 [Patescibacteria group bacterium]
MKKIATLLVLSLLLFIIFYSYLTSPALGHPLGWQLFPLILLGVGSFWSLSEALCTFMYLYLEPFLKKRFSKWA